MLGTKFVETCYIQHSSKHFLSPQSHPEIMQLSPPNAAEVLTKGRMSLPKASRGGWVKWPGWAGG